MNYEVYRNTTLGNTLQECLDEMIQTNQITERLANRVLKEFDKSVNNALATRVKTRYTFKGTLGTYRFCDNVWTLLFRQIEFKESQQDKIVAKNVKFVACDGKILSTVVSKSDSKPAAQVKLHASVCIERMPVITCDMNDLENRYSNLINEINVRRSLLSNHELRHLKDLERAKKKRDKDDEQDLVIETAVDYEDKQLKQLESFQFAKRKTSRGFDKEIAETDNKKLLLQNIDNILDKKLILLVSEPNSSVWQLPIVELNLEDASLRQTAERAVRGLNEKLEVDFMGNAPVGLYKFKKDSLVEKQYFFKAHYKSGAQHLASSKFDFVWIRKDELKDFIKNKDYLACLNNFILDF
ncbi:transcription initiation factor IIA subunit 2 [Brachionus plicatilis]|uniref:Transcription initiation factor IIA subunit 2 n=1 Tax=Brachionus plicatilis TaxID=10195 RepID=A0A3M7QG47_BRAPC|nr:transcription initiation factor IIA subunit 2 [Brachionus plicatilis]